ncbi:hypothetical protein [Metabacillus sp. B2-18]|uniref:hypothetical protein n=1 Tax=Metabacillus sp. B2-18 TaxID=2897333 RepID=UPI001E54E3AC|nr:hypothetical protein [Metabacillus sp. B2-18]UGB33144.1 hypothetical protein LPC09_12310 [Metabacillus sp. B2-18]
MSNRRMSLSGSGKEILDQMSQLLEIERPHGIKIALAKGISKFDGNFDIDYRDSKDKWNIPDNIIRDREYLLFKHLIIQEVQRPLNDEEITQFMLYFIEFGLKTVQEEINNMSSMEDYRITVLG